MSIFDPFINILRAVGGRDGRTDAATGVRQQSTVVPDAPTRYPLGAVRMPSRESPAFSNPRSIDTEPGRVDRDSTTDASTPPHRPTPGKSDLQYGLAPATDRNALVADAAAGSPRGTTVPSEAGSVRPGYQRGDDGSVKLTDKRGRR